MEFPDFVATSIRYYALGYSHRRFEDRAEASRVWSDAPNQGGGRPLPKFDPCTPCGYYMAGHCRYGDACIQAHSVKYGLAVRNEWLHVGDKVAQRLLRDVADEVLGEAAISSAKLFPRAFSRKLEMRTPLQYKGGLRYLLVLDLEGADEITEFPVIILDARDGNELGRFQRYVRPANLFKGCAITPDSPALPFAEVLKDFDVWLHSVLACTADQLGSDAAFVTCGNWDCKHIHTQCSISGITPVPRGFDRWVNIKTSFGNHYNCKIFGMKSMLARMQMLDDSGNVKFGFHHLGMHDVENICRCVLHLLQCGFEIRANGEYSDIGMTSTEIPSVLIVSISSLPKFSGTYRLTNKHEGRPCWSMDKLRLYCSKGGRWCIGTRKALSTNEAPRINVGEISSTSEDADTVFPNAVDGWDHLKGGKWTRISMSVSVPSSP